MKFIKPGIFKLAVLFSLAILPIASYNLNAMEHESTLIAGHGGHGGGGHGGGGGHMGGGGGHHGGDWGHHGGDWDHHGGDWDRGWGGNYFYGGFDTPYYYNSDYNAYPYYYYDSGPGVYFSW